MMRLRDSKLLQASKLTFVLDVCGAAICSASGYLCCIWPVGAICVSGKLMNVPVLLFTWCHAARQN